VKLAVIGAGSTYTPELVSGLGRERDGLDLRELVLHDIDEERLEVVGALAQRMLERQGYTAGLQVTGELDRALDGADFVLVQIRVGGQEARLRDETVPLACGCIGQETTGAGGLAKAFRTVPVVLEIAARTRELAADGAWTVDFTNPVGIVTRALLDAGHRAVGLCNVAIGFQRSFAAMLGVDPGQVSLDHVGLNHLTWERAVRVNGTDRLPELLATYRAQITEKTGQPPGVLSELGVVPSYYLRYFYCHDAVVAEQRQHATRAEEVARLERELLAMYADPAVDRKPALLERRGGAYYSEAAVALLASLVTDGRDTQVVNVRNAGTLAFLPDEAVIEVPSTVGAAGAQPVPVAPLDPQLSGLVGHVAGYEELAVEAALRGGRDRVLAALLAHPLVGQYDLAGQLTDRLIAENRAYLPWADPAGIR